MPAEIGASSKRVALARRTTKETIDLDDRAIDVEMVVHDVRIRDEISFVAGWYVID